MSIADDGGELPEWCAQCDKRTRLIDRAGVVIRCPVCHPDASRLAQFRTCPDCLAPVYEWDFETHVETHLGAPNDRD